MALVEVRDLHVDFGTQNRPLPAVDGVDLDVDAGEIVGIVGESGSGKSMTALALMGLVDAPGRVRAARLAFAGRDLQRLAPRERARLAGGDVAIIFQDPQASLDPCYTVGYQLDEAIRLHGNTAERASRATRRERAIALLAEVEIADPAARLQAYPHQLSGGMAQRVMIASAIAGRPKLLIADEPTTALDVTVQAQVLALLARLRREHAMAMLLITHDLPVVAATADRVLVMYAGQVMETGPVPQIFDAPRHPYTRALLDAIPEHNVDRARLRTIPGVVPGIADRPSACLLGTRCAFFVERCALERPALHGSGAARSVRCHFPLS
ncbi:MAG TPA: ABC transporter ATP-binding protein [Casimicrobiaceae bacterium]|nr:ABC transporter ATP-binding protein [Casimicrobiaceae bacterium]